MAPKLRKPAPRSSRSGAARPEHAHAGARGLSAIGADRPSPSGVAAPAPPAWRDVWAWASALAVLPLLFKSLGAPLGEPVAEDFDFLHRALLSGNHSLLDGGGSQAFWRPVSHQLYYLALGPLMLDHPHWVAAIHLALFAAASLLVYLALRRTWSGPAAAVAASFPLFAESTRTLLSWPSQFVDLGLWFFTALAFYAASRRRLWATLAALALALGCKELAVVAALLIPWMPALGPRDSRERVRWALATGALTLVWGVVYMMVRHAAHLELPHQLEHSSAVLATSLAERYQWAWWNSARAIFSLPLKPTPLDGPLAVAAFAVAAVTAGLQLGRRPAARKRTLTTVAAARDPRHAWVAWGLAWFALASATLVFIYPLWQPNRSAFGSMGLGIALAALIESAHPFMLAAMVALRLFAFALGPMAPAMVTGEPPDTGAFMDFPHLARLQLLMKNVRVTLREKFPTLPHGARVGQHNLPHMAEYAFGGNLALQAWYRDSTLRWTRYDAFERDTSLHPVALVEFEPDGLPMIGLVDPLAARWIIEATDKVYSHEWNDALALLARADSALRDPRAGAMIAMLETRRAASYIGLGRPLDCERSARRAVAGWRSSPNGRYWLAWSLSAQQRWPESAAQLDTLLTYTPTDTLARKLQLYVDRQLGR